MKALLDSARSFRQRVEFESGEYRRLAEGQYPEALFITCSDSRVIPALITGARPGEIFELRNAGNIVPPYGRAGRLGEAATIEYALEVLGVQDIVVCGHSHCGAMGALKSGDDLSALPGVDAWLQLARPRLAPVLDGVTEDPALPDIAQLQRRQPACRCCGITRRRDNVSTPDDCVCTAGTTRWTPARSTNWTRTACFRVHAA